MKDKEKVSENEKEIVKNRKIKMIKIFDVESFWNSFHSSLNQLKASVCKDTNISIANQKISEMKKVMWNSDWSLTLNKTLQKKYKVDWQYSVYLKAIYLRIHTHICVNACKSIFTSIKKNNQEYQVSM